MLAKLTPPRNLLSMRHRRWGVAASCAVHGLAILVLAQLVNLGREQPLAFHISSVWNERQTEEPLEPPTAADFVVSPTAGGSGDRDEQTSLADLFSTAELPEFAVELDAALTAGGSRRGASSRKSQGKDATGGSGSGTGSGVGAGSGPGFFGVVPASGSRVVFVVDSSRSMNQKHDSPLKTRFRRTKFELMKCIVEMQADQSFYVVFFSNETIPMPARSLQPSLPGVRDPFLEWIGQASAGGGPTDPRGALRMALLLQPDVICFLTDGEFADHIARQLKTLRQDRTMIHTFAFGETYGEETLKALAANNRGEYRFVP